MDFTRRTFRVGIDKHGVGALAERLGKFRGELMAGDDFDVLAGERLGKQAAGVPAKRVITSQGIAVADDQGPKSDVRSPPSTCLLVLDLGLFFVLYAAFSFRTPDFRLSFVLTPDFGLRTSDLFIHSSVHPTKNPPVPAIECAKEPGRKHGWSN
jgi:hypothetical protein